MSPAAPDRDLRRIVAELALADADDVEAVLAELDEPGRAKVKALLHEYAGIDAAKVAAEPVTPASLPFDLDGLSPWLAARLGGADGASRAHRLGRGPVDSADRQTPFQMTASASAALRSCAAELDVPEHVRAAVRAARRPQWLAKVPGGSRLHELLVGWSRP